MTNAFIKAQFMEPPGSGTSAAPIGAVKAGTGITISADGTISTSASGGTVSNVVVSNGIQGGGQGPTVFLGLLPPTGTDLGGVRTVSGSGISIDSQGVIRTSSTTTISGGPGVQVTDLGGNSYSVSATPATNSVLGSVIVPGGSNGLRVATSGLLTLAPASPSTLGGIIPGTNCSVAPDGTLNVAGGGTITGVGVGTGLGGGGTAGAVTVFLNPASGTTIGGVYQGDNINIEPDGRISATVTAGVTAITGSSPIAITGTASVPNVRINDATTASSGVVSLTDSISSTSISTAATPNSVKQAYDLAAAALSRTGGVMLAPITFSIGQTFPGTISSTAFTQGGGLLVGSGLPPGYEELPVGSDGQVLTVDSSSSTGLSWANAGQGTLTEIYGTAPILVGPGVDSASRTISVEAATTANLGVVQLSDDPSNTSTSLVPSSFALSLINTVANAALPLSGGTMTGTITFDAGQTFPGALSSSLLDVTGDIVYASAANTPASLPIGAAGTILAVNGGVPAWRTVAQLGLLSTASAATTYAPINSPTLSGPVTVNAGGSPGANAMTISGGNLVLATSFTPTSSADTGSVGEIAWDNSGYLYFCYLPNTWGRVQIDLTPF